jgi:hypothetical protein
MKKLREAIGVEEALLVLGVLLVTVAVWPWAGLSALLVPGGVAIWLSLPVRGPFLWKPEKTERKRG